jgi:hypothetical protein
VATTDKELATKRARVEKLRQQLANAESTRVAREQETSNDVLAAQLDAEASQLEAQLAEAKRTSKVTVVREGVQTITDVARDDVAAAEAQAEATEQAANAQRKDG